MAWARPLYTRRAVDRAGDTIISSAVSFDELADAYQVVNNWRSCHSFPLNTFQSTLRRKARRIDSSVLVAQRIKRLSSIEYKLRRFPTMHLSQMQDLGGCRAIVSDCRKVESLRRAYGRSDLKHKLAREDDYIEHPKSSGYRGIHLIYRYFSDRQTTYNGLLIEVQLRSRLQHAWATAVETVGTFLEQSLKASQGTPAWLRFFALMGSEIATRESSPTVPETPTSQQEWLREISELDRDLDVVTKLRTYGEAIRQIREEVSRAKYYLLELRPSEKTIRIIGFGSGELETATARYLEVEKSLAGPGAEAVLVSVESIDSLEAAYPNYFLDTAAFLDIVSDTLSRA